MSKANPYFSTARRPSAGRPRSQPQSSPERCATESSDLVALMLGTILLILLILLLVGALPSWGYSRGWGYGPSGLVSLLLIIVLVLLVMGRI